MLNIWLRRAMTAGMRRGIAGSRVWLIIGIVAAGGRALSKLATRDPEILYRTVVQPGDVFEIVTSTPARKRKKA
ncbi:MAG TPA: hypothetical protein VNC41_09130 [Acidimicrobiia bacterium]|nr:hypothetical protein [Acidimicrobiia bacterium]